MEPQNTIIIMSDEHDPRYMGMTHPDVKTPTLDRLARTGTRFNNAYTPCPVCVPARASFATGRYVHETRCWDNAIGYDGAITGWGHRLQENGIRYDAIGKMHYRKEDDPLGIDNQIHPMHLKDGVGALWGSVRDPLPNLPEPLRMFKRIGPGVSNYNLYDRNVTNATCEWLVDRSQEQKRAELWVLYVGLTAPHFPLIVPKKYVDMYPDESVHPRKLHPDNGYKLHPWLRASEEYFGQERFFRNEAEKNLAVRTYFGMCSFLDDEIGLILETLDYLGMNESTRIIYTSDHGDNLGSRGQWGKSNMYEECSKVPMIMSGPGIPENHVCNTPVSLIDCYQTILHSAGVLNQNEGNDAGLPGKSLLETSREQDNPERIIFSEYHAFGATNAVFMLRRGRYKYHYYVGFEPELFDLENDPEETRNLAGEPEFREIIKDLEKELRKIVDPEKVDLDAKEDQAELVEQFGGRQKALTVGAPGATPVPGKKQE